MKKSIFARLSAVVIPLALASVLLPASRANAATFTVTSNLDSAAAGTLRNAITQANLTPAADIINFTLTGGTTISLVSNLPAITQPLTINGYSQAPTAENTLTTGATNARPPIELNAAAGGTANTGLNITGNGSVIRGLVIHGFTTGILLAGDNNAVGGCFIGTNPTGTAAAPTTNGTGISISGDTNAVGGVTPGVTLVKNVNLISGNTASGVSVVNATGGVTIFGNLIGTNALGTLAVANNVGVQTTGSDLVLVGGDGFGEGNVVSGNRSDGIQISSGDTPSVQGNTVGLGVDDSTAIPNGGFGIELFSCTGGTIGGDTLGRNIVGKNGSHGIVLSGSTGVSVVSNFVGTDGTGQLDRGNTGDGIHLFRASGNFIGNKIGGPNGNLICANDGNGIAISGDNTLAAQTNTIEANFIGENAAGNVLGNDTNGIQVGDASIGNKIGTAGDGRNYIQGNGSAGVLIQGTATTTTLLNNYIGTDSNGTAPRGNGTDGVRIAANNNTLGDNTPGGRNLISGNPGAGVSITGTLNKLLGNIIGLDANAKVALGNGDGVSISGTTSTNNLIGDGGAVRNIISGNDDNNAGRGVYISGNAHGNSVLGCLVGTDDTGTIAIGNRRGIIIEDATDNIVGGPGLANNNIVAGHEFGIGLTGVLCTGNIVSGNRIGTTLDGNSPLPNEYGIGIANGPSGNTIGGDENISAGSGNLISGNDNNQILIVGANGNFLYGNLLGTRADGLAPLGNFTTSSAISIQGGASNNTVGGLNSSGKRNVISGNAGNGIFFQDAATIENEIYGNYIGVGKDGTTSVPNGAAGIIITDGSSRNLIGASGQGNIIANNGSDGVSIHARTASATEAGGNSIRTNSIFNNGGLGINLLATGEGADVVNANDPNDADTGPNSLQNSPTLSAVTSGPNIVVTATLNAVANFDYIIDLYRSTGPTAAVVEGQTYVISSAGTSGPTGALTRSFTVPAAGGSFFTATAVANGSGGGVRVNDTSEFSAAVQATGAAPSLVVTTTADSGAGSLRQAILNANAGSGTRTISFNIPAGQASGGVWTISPASALPALTTSNVTIDGATQTTFGGNTNTGGPEVVLRGGTSGFPGLTIQGNNNLVKSLVINNFIGTGVPDGIVIEGAATGNRVEGCYIGTNPQGSAGVPNQYGVFIRGTAHGNTIGGTTSAQANIIAFNNYNGILNTSSGLGNAFLGNSIFSNGTPQNGLGIDLSLGGGSGDGITANDLGSPPSTPPDGDTGPNNLQNFPTLSVSHNGTNATITGSLVSTPNTAFRVEYFSSVAPNVSGNGEGQTFLGFQNVTTNATGSVTLPSQVQAVASGSYITATATRTVAPMDTSEFSRAVQALAPATLRADYRFANVLTSSVGTPPALTKIGTGAFATESVGNQAGASRRVYRFNDNTGLQLSPARPTLGNGTYTLAIIGRVDTVSGYNRLVDFSNSTSDSGLYVYNQRLNLYPDGSGTGPLIESNFFYQWVFTRSPSGVTNGYVNGVPTFSFNDSNGDAALTAANILKLFKDDDAVANEASAGAVSRLRIWDGALTAGQVAALDGNPVYTPTLQLVLSRPTVAENAGAAALTATVTRTGPTNTPLTVTLASNDTTEANVSGAASRSLVMAQGVKTVTFNIDAVDDFILDGNQTVTFTASAPGAASVTKTVSVTSNDVPGVIVLATQPLVTNESGGTATFQVRLSAQPSSSVVLPLQSSNTAEGTVSPASLSFTSANWNTAQTVMIRGVDDSAIDGDHAYTIRLLRTTGDPAFSVDPADLAAINLDNEVPPGLLAWGYNSYGQLGDGTKTHRSRPVRVSGYGIPTAVAAGGGHSIAAGGPARASGYNAGGQLGDATKADKSAPVAVAGLNSIKTVAAGWYHSLALLNDGTVWAWGYNASGEVGDGTTIDRSRAVRVTGLTNVIAIAAGTYHSAALKSDGTVWTWGNNFYGQLGDGTDIDRLVPVRAKIPAATAIACGGAHTLAVAGGQVYSWGWNGDGQLGDGTRIVHVLPKVVPGTSGASRVAAGYIHSMALIGSTVRAWGDNEFGQIGNNSHNDALSPVLSQVSGVSAIAAGGAHSLALRADKTLWAWGNNAYGGLGDNSTTNRLVPLQVPGLTNVTLFSGGYAHTLSDGTYAPPPPPPPAKTPYVIALSAAVASARARTISLTWALPLTAASAGDAGNFTVTIKGQEIPFSATFKSATNTTVLTVDEPLTVDTTATVTWANLAAVNKARVANGKVNVVIRK